MGSNLPGQETGGRPFYTACGWACLYALAATPAKTADPPRFALQMVHEWDSCCFQAGNLHANISRYNTFVQSQIADGHSWFQTSANLGACLYQTKSLMSLPSRFGWLCGCACGPAGNFHEINYRDKVTLGVMIERLRRKGGLQRKHFEDLPFNVVLDDWGW